MRRVDSLERSLAPFAGPSSHHHLPSARETTASDHHRTRRYSRLLLQPNGGHLIGLNRFPSNPNLSAIFPSSPSLSPGFHRTGKGASLHFALKINIKKSGYRRRIKQEEKAKVVAAVWRRELINFLAALDIFHQDDFKETDE